MQNETCNTTQHNTTQRIAILILIAIFFIAGFNACKKNPTQATAFTEEQTGRFDTNKMPDPIDPTPDPTPKPEPEPTPDPANPDAPITEDTALLKGKDGVYTDKLNHVYTSNIPIKNPNGSTSYKEYRNYKVTITVANGLLSLSGGPFDDYDYKNMKPYTKSWKNGFKALYKDGKEVAHVKVVGNTIQVHVSALGDSVIFTGTLTSTATPTPAPTFPANSYQNIYAPFVNWADKSQVPEANKIRVSLQDTDTLTKIWQKQIEGGKDNDGKRFIIRDANNNQREPVTGSYYFFDKNFNIVYYRQGKGSLLVRKFIKGTAINYKNINSTKPNTEWGIAGVYETVLSKNEITANNFDQLNIFMGHEDMSGTRGQLEILTINTAYSFDNNTEFGVSFYYTKDNRAEYTDQNPPRGVRNLSWDPGYVNFKFVSVDPYLWHLEDHSSQQGWKRE